MLSTKSTSAPRRYRALIGSTSSLTPFDEITASVVASPSPSSIIRPYWNPEHPPPWTNTRSPASSLFSSASSSEIFDAAAGVTLIISDSPSPVGEYSIIPGGTRIINRPNSLACNQLDAQHDGLVSKRGRNHTGAGGRGPGPGQGTRSRTP